MAIKLETAQIRLKGRFCCRRRRTCTRFLLLCHEKEPPICIILLSFIMFNVRCGVLSDNRHIIVAGKTEVFETWECDWFCQLNELVEDPKTDGQKLVLVVPVRP